MQVPAPTAVTSPVEIPTVAIVGQAILHVPPPVPCVSVLVCPTHKLNVPVGAAGAAVTVTTDVVKQPVPTE